MKIIKTIFLCTVLIGMAACSDNKLRNDIEKDMKTRMEKNSGGKYETISMSDVQSQSMPFYCTSYGNNWQTRSGK